MIVPDLFHADNDLDFAFIMEHAVREIDKNLTVKITTTGKDALTSLNQFALLPKKPRLIFLNDNLRDTPTLPLLVQIREIKQLAAVPVIVFSDVDDPSSVSKVLSTGATAFYPTPKSYRELVNSLKAVCNLWLTDKKTA